jgi:hypothetical protein
MQEYKNVNQMTCGIGLAIFLAIFILTIWSSQFIYAQQSESIKGDLNKSAAVANEVIKDPVLLHKWLEAANGMFSWHVQENKQAYLMTVDIPYPEIQNPKDYFSITVVKFKGKKRPRIISFAVSAMIDPSKGLSIYFASHDNSNVWRMSNVKYENISFSEVNSEYLKVAAEYMYLDKEEKQDLFEPMLGNNGIIFQFFDRSGHQYKIAYPLLWFKEKIDELK